MGALTTAIAQMAAKFNAMKVEVLDLLSRKPKASLAADNALALQDGSTSTNIVNDGRAVANAHITNYQNPHGVTPESLSGMKSSDVDAALANRIPEGALPISRYGDLDGTVISVTSSGLTVSWPAQVHAVMMGYYRPLPAFNITLQPNTSYNVYVRFNGATTSYMFSTEDLAETTTRMWIGRVVTGASTVSSITINRVSRIDTYRTSATPIGSAVPVTVGTPNTSQILAPGWF